MGNQAQATGQTQPRHDIQRILSICECYLRKGDYTTCRGLAVKAQIYNPDHPGPAQILVICSVLAASSPTARPDWYSVLHLPRFSDDVNAIKKNFFLLSNLLNPAKNPYPLAAKAHELVIKAWAILSEPSLKTLIDRELRREENCEGNGATFWTRCPRCSYLYEYEKKYQERVLRCQNVKCRGAFTAEPLPDSAAPPPEVVNGNVYVCYGFSPQGLGMETEGGREEWKLWAPFVSTGSRPVETKTNVMGDELLRNEKGDGFVKISDAEKEDKGGVETGTKDGGYSGVVKREEAKVDSVEKQNNGGKVVIRRKKMMARTRKKVMGRGIRINLNDIFPDEGDDEADMEVEAGGDCKDFGCGGIANGEKGILNFMEGIDAI